MIYNIRQPYEPDLYIDRAQELELAQDWWWKSKKRLLSVKAPPATGKTWFLRKVEERFIEQKAVCFWLDAGKLLLPPNESVAKTNRPNPELVNDWLKELVDDINQRCSGQLEEFAFSNNFTENIEILATKIEELCQEKKLNVCIFLDDADQFDNEGWREFERWLLERFVKIESLRFVIAVREKRSVQTFPLRISETRIKLTVLSGEEQIDRLLAEKFLPSSSNIRNLLAILQANGYAPIHPGLNHFICQYARNKPLTISNFNVADIFSSALASVYPQSQKNDINSLLALLYHLARLTDKWAFEDLLEQLPTSSSKAWDYIHVLEEYSLISQELNLYEIVVGFREFVRAILTEGYFNIGLPKTTIEFPMDFHDKIRENFNIEELEVMCFTLSIDDEDVLVGDSKSRKVTSLIQYCQRHGRELDLIIECQRLRPQVYWLG